MMIKIDFTKYCTFIRYFRVKGDDSRKVSLWKIQSPFFRFFWIMEAKQGLFPKVLEQLPSWNYVGVRIYQGIRMKQRSEWTNERTSAYKNARV